MPKRYRDATLNDIICRVLTDNGRLGTDELEDKLLDYGVGYNRQTLLKKLNKFEEKGYLSKGMIGWTYVWEVRKWKPVSYIHKINYEGFKDIVLDEIFADRSCMTQTSIYLLLEAKGFNYTDSVKYHFLKKMTWEDSLLKYNRSEETNWKETYCVVKKGEDGDAK